MLCLNDIYLVLYFLLLFYWTLLWLFIFLSTYCPSLPPCRVRNPTNQVLCQLISSPLWPELKGRLIFFQPGKRRRRKKKKSVFVAVVLHNVYGKKRKKNFITKQHPLPATQHLSSCLSRSHRHIDKHTHQHTAGGDVNRRTQTYKGGHKEVSRWHVINLNHIFISPSVLSPLFSHLSLSTAGAFFLRLISLFSRSCHCFCWQLPFLLHFLLSPPSPLNHPLLGLIRLHCPPSPTFILS